MNEFDPIKALQEEVSGLVDIHKLVLTHARDYERRLAEAEAEHNAFVKMEAFMKDMLDGARAKLRALQSAAEKGTPALTQLDDGGPS